jgi:hypothetical protein
MSEAIAAPNNIPIETTLKWLLTPDIILNNIAKHTICQGHQHQANNISRQPTSQYEDLFDPPGPEGRSRFSGGFNEILHLPILFELALTIDRKPLLWLES